MFKLTLNNYRSFLNSEFEFARINILIGENSSGKSSILKFFLLLKQSLVNYRNSIFTFSGEEIDLGNFQDIIYYNDKDKHLEFSISVKDGFYDYCNDFLRDKNSKLDEEPLESYKNYFESETLYRVEIKRELTKLSSLTVHFKNDSIGILTLHFRAKPDDDDAIYQKEKLDIIYKNFERNKEYLIKNVSFDNTAFLNFISSSDLSKIIKLEYPDERSLFLEIAILLLSQNYIEEIVNSTSYINPIHSKPERIYYKRDKRRFNNAVDLQALINLLDNDRFMSLFKSKLVPIIKDFGLAEDITLINNDQLPVVELKVQIKKLWSNISDVGYGVAMQLPILLHSFLMETAKSDRMVLIEQPEIHLHPKLQAKFIEALLTLGKTNKYIIETHSEHIVRKLQAMVKKGELDIKKDDVRIYYFKRDHDKTNISLHKITESGKLIPDLPEGFFDNSFKLAMELL
ncbi:DUF3696 domain-containing protein [Leptospira yanagawae]|uniref:DUF3696 domain-containing protein n=1 Tax=Leptospira yanagawae TaxID=293069 RepID=A0ABY2M3J6_9LEPT|nr:DUF3696 domain-containing protein [Leptospira yanagawae]TGL23143.1 DUF3696 domain-containing protein [Leptospira yanagawae]